MVTASDRMLEYSAPPLPAAEVYVFGTLSQAHAAGFVGPGLRHPEHPFLRAVCLRDGGQLLNEQMRGMMISRIVITGSARDAAERIWAANQTLGRLRAEARTHLRAAPGIFLEL